MKQKVLAYLDRTNKRQRAAAISTLVIALLLVLIQFIPPQRSVASYCKVYKTEEAKLANAKGNTYSVTVFKHGSSDPHDFATAFGNLDRVAPSDIEPHVRTLKLIFDKIDSDPSQALSASLSGIGAESSVKSWTKVNCRIQ